MKTIKLCVTAFAIALCAGFSSCSNEYDDSEIWDKVNELFNRVQKLEAEIEKQNSNIAALQNIFDAIKDNVYVTSIEELADNEGYILNFSNGEEFSIYHGKDGSNSLVDVKKDNNGLYYWIVNEEWLLDEDGNKIQAQGIDGVVPQLKLEGYNLYVSYDEGQNWLELGSITDESNLNIGSIFDNISIVDQEILFELTNGDSISLPLTNKNNIQFKDASVKLICILYWDTNKDGELSYEEAASVTDIGLVFCGSPIITFDEFQHFTGLVSIPEEAFAESTLQQITLPKNITNIGNGAFAECNMKNIIIPDAVKEIGEMAFYANPQLTSITLGKSLEKIRNEAFDQCLNVKEVFSKNPNTPWRGSNPFSTRINGTAVMYVPIGSYKSYFSSYIVFFKDIIEIDL